MGQRSIPAPFLMKTYELVDDETTNEVVSWGDKGTTFVVWSTADFARDLLPKYFKHNNFSSFVRQLNTYGFRKIVPDKWEFANDNFKKGQKDLLSEIRRRKASHAGKPIVAGGSQSLSGEDGGSTSTSSPGTVEIADLSGENEKLRRDNEMLSSELVRTKKQCEELMGFLSAHLEVDPDQIDKIMQQGMVGIMESGSHEDSLVEEGHFGNFSENDIDHDVDNDNDNDNDDDDDEKEGLKLFGVWLKEVGKKRGRCYDFQSDNNSSLGLIGAQKIMKIG